MVDVNVDRTKLASIYDAYAQTRKDVGKEQWKEDERARFLKALQKSDARNLIEIGAGTGEDSLFFQNNGLVVKAVDLSPKHVEMTRKLGIDAEVMDFYYMDFGGTRFDAAYLMNSLVHVPKGDLQQVLKNIARVVKSGGLIYVGEYGGEDFEGIRENDKYTPHRFFSFYLFQDFKKVLEGMFDIQEERRIPLSTMELHAFILRNR